MKEILRAEGMVKEFVTGDIVLRALKGVDFSINEGEFVVVLGPSGSGKSTMLNIIGGIETITDGKLFYNDIAVHDLNKSGLSDYRRKYVGFIFQFYNLMPNLTAYENIALAAELSSDPLNAKELLAAVGLENRADYYPAKMSGGQQQRVAIARALCKNPDILLCDEPTGALDIKTGVEVLKLLLDFNQKYHKTILVVTHNADIAKVADKVFYFRDGNIERVAINESPLTPDEVEW
ncbi:MAG: ABC transporter ATP-binding protein [Lachnospiraceae bacterium]|nr:ABC transporter ATP-binding protein [Lachnospiraceae bacterium]